MLDVAAHNAHMTHLCDTHKKIPTPIQKPASPMSASSSGSSSQLRWGLCIAGGIAGTCLAVWGVRRLSRYVSRQMERQDLLLEVRLETCTAISPPTSVSDLTHLFASTVPRKTAAEPRAAPAD